MGRRRVQFSTVCKGAGDFLTGWARLLSVLAMAVRLVVRHSAREAGLGHAQSNEFCYEFEQARIVIGRGKGADVRLPDLSVSEHHATLERSGASHTLRDEGSTNGTRVGEVTLVSARPRQLSPGDVIEIGSFLLGFELGPLRQGVTPPERTASLARRMLRDVVGTAHPAASPPTLTVVAGPDLGLSMRLSETQVSLVIGRADDAGLVLQDPDASREHLEITRDADGTLARDLGSKNGLVVNGKAARERRLKHGDILSVGRNLIMYEDPAEHAIKQLDGQADLTITRTRKASLEPRPSEPSKTEPAAVAAAPQVDLGRSPMDAMVYAMAAVLLIASLAGLIWLFA